MQEFWSLDGWFDLGGILRIYVDSLKLNIFYKIILLFIIDFVDFVVVEVLEKYGLEKENFKDYCIVWVMFFFGVQYFDEKGVKEIIFDDDECFL